jgi:hypothetical protein
VGTCTRACDDASASKKDDLSGLCSRLQAARDRRQAALQALGPSGGRRTGGPSPPTSGASPLALLVATVQMGGSSDSFPTSQEMAQRLYPYHAAAAAGADGESGDEADADMETGDPTNTTAPHQRRRRRQYSAAADDGPAGMPPRSISDPLSAETWPALASSPTDGGEGAAARGSPLRPRMARARTSDDRTPP